MRRRLSSERTFLRGYKITNGHTGMCPICYRPIAKTDDVHLETGDQFVPGKGIVQAKPKHLACWRKAATVQDVPKMLGGL